jgi:uncharacterized spore protein YtfJ
VLELLCRFATTKSTTAQPHSEQDKHILPLCELSVAFGGGSGYSADDERCAGIEPMAGGGELLGVGARTTPIAVLIVEGQIVRLAAIDPDGTS